MSRFQLITMACECVFILVLLFPHFLVGKILIVTESGASSARESIAELLKNEEDRYFYQTIKISRDDEEKSLSEVCAAFEKGVSLIVDMTWTGWPALQNISTVSGTPLILIESSLKTVVRALNEVLRKIRSATDAVIILEDKAKIEEAIYYFSDLSHLRVYIVENESDEYIQNVKIMRPTPSFYVILGSSKFVSTTYNTAKNHNFITNIDRWLFFTTDFNTNILYNTSQTIIGIYTKHSFCCALMDQSTNCKCSNSIDIINYAESAMIFRVFEWFSLVRKQLLISKYVTFLCYAQQPANESQISRELYTRLNQSILRSPILEAKMGQVALIHLRIEFYVNSSKGVSLGSWNFENGVTLNQSYVIVPVKRFFRVGVAKSIPWSYQMSKSHIQTQKKESSETHHWEGYCIDFLDRLAHELYFDYELVPREDFGRRNKDGSWSGLVGDLVADQTDLVVAPLTMTSEREEVIDFVVPYFEQTGISIVIRKPERRTSLFKFMTVLRLEVWLSIVGALIMTALMIWLLDKYSPYSAQNNKQLRSQSYRKFTLKESFWFAMTSFTPQGGGETPKALSGRTLVAAYWLFVVLMLATFTANLAAFLTVERMQAPVQSLEQLSRQSRINYTVVRNSDTHEYFKNMKHAEDILYKMWKEVTLNVSSYDTQYRVWDYPIKEQYGHILQALEKAGPVTDAETGFRMVNEHESGWFALIHDAAEVRYAVTRNCNLTEVGEPFAEQPYAVAVQQGSQLNEEISRKILDLQKERYFESLTAKYWNSSSRGECIHSDDNEGITLESLGGVFIATLFGLALALVTLAVEIILHKRRLNARVNGSEFKIYKEYISRKEFGTEYKQHKGSLLIHPKNPVLTVFPRSQLY